MKKSTKQTTIAPVIEHDSPRIAGATAVPFKSIDQITTEYLLHKSKEKKNYGENDYLDDFALAARFLCHAYQQQSFSIQDVYNAVKHRDTPAFALIIFFDEWCAALKRSGRLKTLLSLGTNATYAFQ